MIPTTFCEFIATARSTLPLPSKSAAATPIGLLKPTIVVFAGANAIGGPTTALQMNPWQAPDLQSALALQILPLPHLVHWAPPQSMSDSKPSFTPLAQGITG